MNAFLRQFAHDLFGALRDLIPIILVVSLFQLFVLSAPLPNLGDIMLGLVMVVLGLAFFMRGLEMGLFPVGEALAHALARRGSLLWLILFAFSLGFATTVAEPALIAIAAEAAQVASQEGLLIDSDAARDSYGFGLRMTVAVAVGLSLVLGVLRILKGWPLHYLIIGGYLLVVVLSLMAPEAIIGIAFDSGGVTTSTVTVPLVTALGVGLATVIHGRNPLVDGFGLIAFASLSPMIFVMLYGMWFFMV